MAMAMVGDGGGASLSESAVFEVDQPKLAYRIRQVSSLLVEMK